MKNILLPVLRAHSTQLKSELASLLKMKRSTVVEKKVRAIVATRINALIDDLKECGEQIRQLADTHKFAIGDVLTDAMARGYGLEIHRREDYVKPRRRRAKPQRHDSRRSAR